METARRVQSRARSFSRHPAMRLAGEPHGYGAQVPASERARGLRGEYASLSRASVEPHRPACGPRTPPSRDGRVGCGKGAAVPAGSLLH